MKLNIRNVKAKAGMTLLELTVVILVLLSLISILFVGARQWKKGSDRAGCIMLQRNIQQAVRGDACEAFRDPQLVGRVVESLRGMEVGRLDDEAAAVIPTDRVSHIGTQAVRAVLRVEADDADIEWRT